MIIAIGLFDLGIGGFDKGRFEASNPRVNLGTDLTVSRARAWLRTNASDDRELVAH